MTICPRTIDYCFPYCFWNFCNLIIPKQGIEMESIFPKRVVENLKKWAPSPPLSSYIQVSPLGVPRCSSELQLAMVSKESMQSLQKAEPSSTFAIIASPKNVGYKLQRGYVTRCNRPATCLAMPLQHKLQRKSHRVTLVVELGFTFCNDCRDFLKPLQVAVRDCKV